VDHRAHALERSGERAGVAEIAGGPFDAGGCHRRPGAPAQHADCMAVGDEVTYEMATDESRPAGNENHDTTPPAGLRASCGTMVAAPRRTLGMLRRRIAEPARKNARSAGSASASSVPLASR
jgi:hypothetical protein